MNIGIIGIIGISLKGICKMKTVVEKLENLRNKMKENDVQAYIICTEDYHGSEYAGDYFKEREYMSGFTGSAARQECKGNSYNRRII